MTYPAIGSKVRCLRAPSFAVPETAAAMVGQIGVVIHQLPADPDYEDDPGAIGIQYPLTPYSDNRIAQDLNLEGIAWERAT